MLCWSIRVSHNNCVYIAIRRFQYNAEKPWISFITLLDLWYKKCYKNAIFFYYRLYLMFWPFHDLINALPVHLGWPRKMCKYLHQADYWIWGNGCFLVEKCSNQCNFTAQWWWCYLENNLIGRFTHLVTDLLVRFGCPRITVSIFGPSRWFSLR